MNESVEAHTGAVPQAMVRRAATRPMLTLLRRELWEHRALWIAPLVVSAGLLIGAVFGRAEFPTSRFPGNVRASPQEFYDIFAAGVVLGIG
ncbi:MAG: hypothetical protein ACREUG_02355, partial [Steroidobacteraceae bacterium]